MSPKHHTTLCDTDVPAELSGLLLLDWVVEKYEPTHMIAMFSGGHDSLVATHVASRHPSLSFACHINTGIGVEETREFVRETTKALHIPFKEYTAEGNRDRNGDADPQRIEDFIFEHGFPGPPQHYRMYQRLKERPLRHMIRELDRRPEDRTILVTGVRAEESVRRTAHVDRVQVWEGTKLWVAPIWDMSKRDVNDYVDDHELPRNPVVANLHMSGECLCGAYAHDGELGELELFYPEVAAHIKRLEAECQERGFPWGWEERPPKWWDRVSRGEQILPEVAEFLCTSCNHRHGEQAHG